MVREDTLVVVGEKRARDVDIRAALLCSNGCALCNVGEVDVANVGGSTNYPKSGASLPVSRVGIADGDVRQVQS
ncbi:MAG: hypothetical protein RIS19_950 [Actinomycetota bacterium]